MLWDSKRNAWLREAGGQMFVTYRASQAKQRRSLGFQEGGEQVIEGGGSCGE